MVNASGEMLSVFPFLMQAKYNGRLPAARTREHLTVKEIIMTYLFSRENKQTSSRCGAQFGETWSW